MKLKKFVLILFILVGHSSAFAKALIDQEIYDIILTLTNPILEAAGLEKNDLSIIILNDNSINAMTPGNKTIFIHSGLITNLSLDSPDPLLGVIAHEIGHISSNHISKKIQSMDIISKGTIIGQAIGMFTSVLSGNPELGYAIMAGSSNYGQQIYLNNSREHEEEADQLALIYLQKANYTKNGLLEVLKVFSNSDSGLNNIPFLLTHPMSQKRIEKVRSFENKIDKSQISDDNLFHYIRATAKLEAIIRDPKFIFEKYKSDNSDIALYCKAIALHKEIKNEEAIAILNNLINKNPTDPYIYQLKAEILYSDGQTNESIESFSNAFSLYDSNKIFSSIEFAQALISSYDKTHAYKAIDILIKTIPQITEIFLPMKSIALKLLAAAYSTTENIPMSYVTLLERALINKNASEIEKYKKISDKIIKIDSPEYSSLQYLKERYALA